MEFPPVFSLQPIHLNSKENLMKRLLIPVLTLLAISLAGAALAADEARIASVDLRKIALESKAGKEATKTMEKIAGKLQGKLKAREAELNKLKDALEGKGKQLSAKEITAKEKEIRKKLDQYREAAENAQKEMQAKEEEIGNRIMAEIEKIIKEYAPKNGFALVIRKGDIIYSDGKYQVTEVTDEILKIFDSAPPEGAPKEEAPKK